VDAGTIVNLEGTNYQDTKATFALKAMMDYTGIEGKNNFSIP
jgi:hypothetical protein